MLLTNQKYSFFKRIKRVYERSNDNSAKQALTQNISYGNYEDKKEYFIYNNDNGDLTKVELKKKEFLKALDTDQDKAEAYIQKHGGSFNEVYVVNLLTEINQHSLAGISQ